MDSLLIAAYQNFKAELQKLELESERSVESCADRYKDLNPQALYTSFEDLENLCTHPLVTGVWLDLGGGSGRTSLVYSFLTGKPSISLEIDTARNLVGKKCSQKYNLPSTHINCDLLTEDIPFADTYFLYFPTGIVLDRILWQLSERVGFSLLVIESHGDLLERISREVGYEEVARIPLKTPRHNPEAFIFKKVAIGPAPLPHTLSFCDKLLLIRDSQGEWIASSLGLEWLGEDRYQFLHPPRTISWNNDFIRALEESESDYSLISNISDLRKRGEVRIALVNGQEYVALIRKIRITPSLGLEISSSELIEWSDISKISQGSILCYESSSCFFSLPAL